ncbi:MAG: hypothetical protein ACLFV7_11795 [Phycisphaerae bacterium]
MSKSSLIFGIVVAVGLHALLLMPWWTGADTVPPKPPAAPKVAITPPPQPVPEPPRQPEPEPEPEPAKQPQPKPRPEPPQEKPTPPLRKVHNTPAQKDPPPQEGDTHARKVEEIDEADLPPMRIVWESAGALRQIAASLGMKVVAVNNAAEVVGEVSTATGRLVEFTGELDHYSNRVRTLPLSFFGEELTGPRAGEAVRLWVLVPSRVDRRWVALQRQAIASTGLDVASVHELTGEFRNGSTGVRLVVTKIRGDAN